MLNTTIHATITPAELHTDRNLAGELLVFNASRTKYLGKVKATGAAFHACDENDKPRALRTTERQCLNLFHYGF